jgi:O-acetyl-ADP-ribose deacetylase (regulator of RNase III)
MPAESNAGESEPAGSDPRLEVVEGDITQLDVDAIVNAANDRLRPGGGVCGAIHRAAGPDLAQACAEIGGCDCGDAKTTPGFRLKARHVIHTVGPVWHGGNRNEDAMLASAYRNSLKQAIQVGARSVAFPAISTGVFGYPLERATRIAVETVRDFLDRENPPIDKVIFTTFGDEATQVYKRVLAEAAV